jgi:hypothetical protein
VAVVNLSTLPLSKLGDDEKAVAKRLLSQLHDRQRANRRQDLYYGARQAVRDLGIAVPPHLTDLEAALGWPAMAVDVLNERIRQDGWTIPGVEGDGGLDEIESANQLNRELRVGAQLAMRHGISFGVAGKGNEAEGEPAVLVTVEPATRMTATWDHRRKAVTEALLADTSGGRGWVTGGTLWIGNRLIEMTRKGGRWELVERFDNNVGRPPIVRFVNRYSADRGGRSEITRPLRAYSDNAIRTIVSMEVSRDFHAAPKFWLLGAEESQFVGPNGEKKSAWDTYIGRLNAIPATEDGQVPTIQQFQGASPQPFIEQMRMLAQMVSAESALPISYLGLVHDANPASADAALVGEARLNLRAEDRQDDLGDDRGQLAKFAMWIRDGKEPTSTPRPVWRNPATPTLSAAADATTKLVAQDILPKDSQVTLRRIGLNENDIETLRNERRRNNGTAALRAIGKRSAGGNDPAVPPGSPPADLAG